MSYLNGKYFSLTGDQTIDAMTHGYKWDLTNNRTINWSVSNGNNGEFWYNPTSTASMLQTVFDNISSYIDVKLTYAGFYQTPTSARTSGSDINISLDGLGIHTPGNDVWAVGYFPKPNDIHKGDIYLNINSEANYLESYAPGSAGYALAIHEIGHTLGLKHPHDSGGTGRPTFSNLGLSWLDKDYVSVMSYNDDYSWNNISWEPSTPMALDVLALQYIYGKNLSTNAGNTTHYLTNNSQYSTIWDASGFDTIDLSNAAESWVLTLPEALLSTLTDTKTGIAIPTAYYDWSSPLTATWLMGDIENAFGSKYDDTINGNSLNNVIIGSKGNDIIDGGVGNDTAIYSGKAYEYQIVRNGDIFTVKDVTVGYDGIDTLKNIEQLKFADYNLILDQNSAVDTIVYQLYQAAFARMPDTAGFRYWADTAEANGMTALKIAGSFINSSEFSQKFGANPSNADYVTKLYHNVLGRAPDQDGLHYWINLADNGRSDQQLLVDFATSNENIQLTGQYSADNVFWTI